MFIAFLVLFAVNWVALALRIGSAATAAWPETLLLLATAGTLLVGLARRLPLQNVVVSVVLIAGISGLTTAVSARTGIPFGPRAFSEPAGPTIGETVPWFIPPLWTAIIVSSRGVARLMARPWRKTNYYGFWVIGLTAAVMGLRNSISRTTPLPTSTASSTHRSRRREHAVPRRRSELRPMQRIFVRENISLAEGRRRVAQE